MNCLASLLERESLKPNEGKSRAQILKEISKRSQLSKSALKLLNEKEIIERISHPNILNCLEIIGNLIFPHYMFSIVS